MKTLIEKCIHRFDVDMSGLSSKVKLKVSLSILFLAKDSEIDSVYIDRIVVISEGYSSNFLTKTNSRIRRIDLISKLFAPVVTGFIVSFVSMIASAVSLAIWNIFSVFLQYWLLHSVYKGIPALSESSLMVRKFVQKVSESTFIRAWRVYLQQDVVLPGLSLALLYFTVLSSEIDAVLRYSEMSRRAILIPDMDISWKRTLVIVEPCAENIPRVRYRSLTTFTLCVISEGTEGDERRLYASDDIDKKDDSHASEEKALFIGDEEASRSEHALP
ncbi:solute carrier family 40 member 2-like protein isoform X2 [Tanacetum coccineum]